jgi:formylglycine-generating enzyme required for sulfatase activity
VPPLGPIPNFQEFTVSRPALEVPQQQRITNASGIEFVLIPAGRFETGSSINPEGAVRKYGGNAEWFRYEHPRHAVRIEQPFYLQTTEATVGQWRRFAQEMGYKTEAETGGGVYVWSGSEWGQREEANWDNPLFLRTTVIRSPVCPGMTFRSLSAG